MIIVVAWLGCTGGGDGPTSGDTAVTSDPSSGPLGLGPTNPFPSLAQVGTDGRLALQGMPQTRQPLPVGRLSWRTGFSPGQTAMVVLPGVDSASLPGFVAPSAGQGSVRMVDLTASAWVPCMAELDAHPEAVDQPALLVRPLHALTVGHRVAVVVTTEAVARPPGFDPERPMNRAVLGELAGLGVMEEEVAVAWEFPIGDGSAPLRSAIEQRRRSDFPDPVFEKVRGNDGALPPRTWRIAEGSFETTGVLGDDGRIVLERDGSITPTAKPFEASLYVHVPAGVEDAPAGTVPVVVFGHGIFQSPEAYFDVEKDADGVLRLAEDLGAIVVGTTWRGLSNEDLTLALGVAGDFSRLPEMTGRLVQSQLAVREMIEALRAGSWFDDPVFHGSTGQSLPDPDHVSYYGISLGGIEGAVLMALSPPVDAAVLHVPGAMWSTMLERSSNWSLFEGVFGPAVPDPVDRQLLYSVSQLWWDPVDPIAYADQIADQPVLLQESVGDEQVPNLTTEALARSAGIPALVPFVDAPALDTMVLPAPDGSAALVQFDPETARPEPVNRPARRTGAHEGPRQWSGQRGQVVRFLDPERPGQLVHLCGEQACAASNRGP